jgi:hypothetical protein
MALPVAKMTALGDNFVRCFSQRPWHYARI